MAAAVGESAIAPEATPTSGSVAPGQQIDGTYEVSREKAPSHPFFKPAVGRALDFADTAKKKLQLQLKHLAETYPDIPGMAELLESSKIQMPASTRRLAVLGDSGQGKSSLINSLLHIPDIAHTSDMGSACTSVVIEYHQKGVSQKSPIYITVEFYSGTSLEEMVTNMAWSCRLYWLQSAQESDQNLGDTDDSDLDDCQKKSQVAEEALKSAFGHHQGFSVEFLRDLSEGAEDRVNKQLVAWAHAIEWPSGEKITTPEGSTIWQSSVDTVEGCAQKTGFFMKDKLWPFTKVIKVYLDSPILTTGIILVDLPGLHDANLARVKASKLYLLDCDEVLIVGRIGRITTDKSIKRYIMDEAERLKALRNQDKPGSKKLVITVVCTAADDINVKAAIAEFVGTNKPISAAQMQQLKAEVTAAKASRDYERKHAAEQRINCKLWAARNQRVGMKMKKTYESETGERLAVFCVGNRAYEDLCETGDTAFVEATGIPALRRYCNSITANDRLAEARYWIQTTVPGLCQSAEAWVHRMLSDFKLGEKKRRVITKRLEKIRSKLPGLIAKYLRDYLDAIWGKFMETWIAYQGEWSRAAILESVAWESWHSASYNAWCLNHGHHETPARGHVNWNRLLTYRMRKDLVKPWQVLLANLKQVQSGLVKMLVANLDKFVEDKLEGVPCAERKILAATIKSTTNIWRHRMTKEISKLIRHVSNMKVQITINDELSYVTREMVPTYRKAAKRRGIGHAVRQRRCIAEKMGSKTLFPNIATELLRDKETGIKNATESVLSSAKWLLDTMVHEFDVVLTPKESNLVMESFVLEFKKAIDEVSEGLARLEKF